MRGKTYAEALELTGKLLEEYWRNEEYKDLVNAGTPETLAELSQLEDLTLEESPVTSNYGILVSLAEKPSHLDFRSEIEGCPIVYQVEGK